MTESRRQILRLPTHRNPRSADRAASAPYNFVPLPERVVPAVNDASELPGHDRYDTRSYRHSGHFDVELTTRSPLYVRCALERERFDQSGSAEDSQAGFRDQVKNAPDFFYTASRDVPVIPGSSLRGMLRAQVEIVSYGKVSPVTDQKLFYRSVDNSSLGRSYRERMVGALPRGESKVEAGFLRKQPSGWSILVSQKLTIPYRQLPPRIHDGGVPNWQYQYRPIWLRRIGSGAQDVEYSWEAKESFARGLLVITGPMTNRDPKRSKHHEFVFLDPAPDAEQIDVRDELIRRFEDDDQITRWQERAFPRGEPRQNSRPRDGALQGEASGPGEPVFFLRENGKLTFFGRAGMFRLPYRYSPSDFVPEALCDDQVIDFAEAIFGCCGRD